MLGHKTETSEDLMLLASNYKAKKKMGKRKRTNESGGEISGGGGAMN